MSHSTRSLSPRFADASDAEPDFVELPQTPASPPAPRPRVAVKEPSPLTPRGNAVPSLRSVSGDEEQRSWTERLMQRFLGDEGAAYAISFVMHIILLAILAIPILQNVRQGPSFTTIVAVTEEEPLDVSELVNTELSLPDPIQKGDVTPRFADMDLDRPVPLTHSLFNDSIQAGDPKGTVLDAGSAARFRELPESAVIAGSFAAYCKPKPLDGFKGPQPKPGDSPLPYQDYYIVLQIDVPEGKTRFPLGDLKGEVIGTDGYRQEIPSNKPGRDTHLKIKGRDGYYVTAPKTIPVKDGIVEIFVFVPGAKDQVLDTIRISSRMLDESQELEIVFEEQD